VSATREDTLPVRAFEAAAVAADAASVADALGETDRRHDRGWLMRRLLAVADLLALSGAFLAVDLTYPRSVTGDAVPFDTEFALFFLTLPGWIVLAKLYGLYDLDEERADHSTADELIGVFHLVTVGAFIFYAGAWLTGLAQPTPSKIISFWLIAIVLLMATRSVARIVARRNRCYVQNTLIVGAGDVGQLLARKMLKHHGINLIGFVDTAPKERGDDLGDLILLGSPEDLPWLIEAHAIDRVIVAFSNDGHQETLELIRTLTTLGVCVDVVPRLFPLMGQSVGVHSIEGLPLVALPRWRPGRSTLLLKRAMDISFSLLGLVALAPVFAVVALRIKLNSPGPVFFRQMRMGADERPFEMLKFRTMELDAEARKHELAALNKHALATGDPRMFKVPDDPRVTGFGRFLRRYSLDELPQLINVLRGDMSLVGPRPLVLDEDRHVTEWRRRRLLVKPGMTGPWQVLGRDDISFEEMVELDYRYVAGWSLLNDLLLLLRTLPAVVRARSAY
jgi:exopolysaccharide biosynthesis polyprenyl glycosylphosphotransferase